MSAKLGAVLHLRALGIPDAEGSIEVAGRD